MKHALLFAVFSLLLPFATAQENSIEVRIEAFLVTQEGIYVPTTQARPTQVVEYWIFARNSDPTTLPAGSVSVDGPVPESSLYILGSAFNDGNFDVEFSDGTSFVDSEADPVRTVRWTYLQPLEPNQEVKVTYRVVIGDELPTETYADFAGFKSNDTDTNYGSADEFTQAMFGHLSVIQVDCPENVARDVEGAAETTCGRSADSFDLFRQKWDLYADYESEVPVVPTPTSAWRSSNDVYSRDYELNGFPYTVTFSETTEGGGFVTVAHRR